MEIVVRRFARYYKAVHGRLSICGEHVCDTLESSDNCLPPGTYPLRGETVKGVRRRCLTLGEQARLLACNGPFTLEGGQISVGECRHLGFLIHCREYFEPLLERVRMAQRRHKTITVIIREDDDGYAFVYDLSSFMFFRSHPSNRMMIV